MKRRIKILAVGRREPAGVPFVKPDAVVTRIEVSAILDITGLTTSEAEHARKSLTSNLMTAVQGTTYTGLYLSDVKVV